MKINKENFTKACLEAKEVIDSSPQTSSILKKLGGDDTAMIKALFKFIKVGNYCPNCIYPLVTKYPKLNTFECPDCGARWNQEDLDNLKLED